MNLKLKLATVVSSTVLLCATSMAQEERTTSSTFPKPALVDTALRPHVGLLAGVAAGEGALNSGMEYGIDAGYQPYVPFGVGIELSSATADVDSGLISDDLTRTKLLAKVTYNFGGQIPLIRDSYVGVGAGPMLESIGGDDDLYLGVMPILGFDIPLQSKPREYMSAGMNVRYLVSSSGIPNSTSVNGMLKYWF